MNDENDDMVLVHGSYKQHYDTAMRAKHLKVDRVWSGDVTRNPYLIENMVFIEHEGLAEITLDDCYSDYVNQSSYFKIDWN